MKRFPVVFLFAGTLAAQCPPVPARQDPALEQVLHEKPCMSGSYVNPSWITSLAWAKITGVPAFAPTAQASTHATTGSDQVIPAAIVTDPIAGLLPKFRLAVAKVRNGASDAKILAIGDSTVMGFGSTLGTTLPWVGAWPTRLSSLINARIPSAVGFAIPVSTLGGTDNRWTFGADWTLSTFGVGLGWGGMAAIQATSPAGNLVFTPGGTASTDSYAIYYVTSGGNGTITATATGGSATPINTNSAGGIAVTVVTAAAAATGNSVTFSAVGNVYVLGVEPFLSTTRKIRLGNAAVYGTQTGIWTGIAFYGPIPAIKAYAPDLTLICLGINDAGSSVSPATFQANMSALIQAAQVSGDVILVTMPPSQFAPNATFEAAYQAIYRALSATYNVPIVDIYGRFAATWQAALMSDSLHPNDYGYWDIASAVNTVLQRIF
jgi:hypothetical protein